MQIGTGGYEDYRKTRSETSRRANQKSHAYASAM